MVKIQGPCSNDDKNLLRYTYDGIKSANSGGGIHWNGASK